VCCLFCCVVFYPIATRGTEEDETLELAEKNDKNCDFMSFNKQSAPFSSPDGTNEPLVFARIH